MLDYAIKHSDKVDTTYRSTVLGNRKYKYWVYATYEVNTIELGDSEWTSMSRVSLDTQGNILGFMRADIA